MAISMIDQKKLLDAGFGLFRLELEIVTIKTIKVPGCWRTYKKYPTKRECKAAWNFLMMNDMYIGG